MKPSVASRWSSAVARLLQFKRPVETKAKQPKMYQPKKVRLFVKPYCGWCAQAMDWLEASGIEFEALDVVASEKAYEEMYRLSGQTLAPVIDVDGKILADFGARDLAAFWNKISTADKRR
jgi:glutaredoxin